MGAGNVAPAPVSDVPLNPPVPVLLVPFLLLHAVPSTTMTRAAAAIEPNLPNFLIVPSLERSVRNKTLRAQDADSPEVPRLLGLGVRGRPLSPKLAGCREPSGAER